MLQAELLADVSNVIGESPVWLEATGSLYWVDAKGSAVYRWSAADSAVESVSLREAITALVPRAGGGWILVTEDGLCSAATDFSAVTPIVDPSAHDPETRLNDGVADRWGRVWTGSQSREDPPAPVGRLYLVGPGSDVVELDDGFAVANGIAFSPDGDRAYVSDMFHRRIRVYRLDPDSSEVLGSLPPIVTTGPGFPDGLTVDREGLLWVAYWHGARAERLELNGAIATRVAVPAGHATRCCLGGPSGSQLFVTSARYALDEDQLQRQPYSGALFSVEVEGNGLPPAEARL